MLAVRVSFHGFAGEHESGTYDRVMIGREDIQAIEAGSEPPRIVVIATRDDDGFWLPCGDDSRRAYPDVIVSPVSQPQESAR